MYSLLGHSVRQECTKPNKSILYLNEGVHVLLGVLRELVLIIVVTVEVFEFFAILRIIISSIFVRANAEN